ncbi:MAG: site-specific integrase [Bacteroides sp.]|nr:site-specific integrase [Bacteroides sp.]
MATYRVFQKAINKKGEAPIYISFYINREKVEVPTKISISPSDFDKEKEVIKLSCEFAKDKNLIISNIKSAINDILVRYRLRNESISVTTFWQEYRNPRQYKSFFDFCLAYQRLRFQEITVSTQKKHKACLGNLRDFKEIIYFDELTPEFFRRFVLYLRNRRGNAEVTIKTIGIISIYLNEAVRKELIKENPIHGLRLRGCQETTAVALEEEELNRLVELYKTGSLYGSQYKSLEFFLFLCFSSLHIADAKALDISQIGEKEFSYIRAKMLNIRPRVVRVPISEPLRILIDKQKGNRKSGLLWDEILSDQKINKHLKTIAELAGIEKKLSAKVGRHTFATIFLRKTKDLNALKDIMGHSNIKQTLVYAHVLDQDRKMGVQIFNTFSL